MALDVRLRHAARRPDVARQERELTEELAGSKRDDRAGTLRLDKDVDGTRVDHVEYVADLTLVDYGVTGLVGLGERREGEGVELRVAQDVREELVLDFDLWGARLGMFSSTSFPQQARSRSTKCPRNTHLFEERDLRVRPSLLELARDRPKRRPADSPQLAVEPRP